MSKKILNNRTKTQGVGKVMGRTSGKMVWNEHVQRMVTPKLNTAINNNRAKKVK